MKFTQIRHGSHIIQYKNKKFLVDPVLADKATTFALPMGRVNEKNPLKPMPFNTDFIMDIDAVILTHLHFDHFDEVAKALLPKHIQFYCHVADVKKVTQEGFINVTGIDGKIVLDNEMSIEVVNGGRHGKGIRRMMMGRTTGYVLKDLSRDRVEPAVFLVGDSLWCKEIETALDSHQPDVIIAFGGEARLMNKPITMSTWDLDQMARYAKKAKIIVNHLDTWNHCYLTRDLLNSFLDEKSYKNRFLVPDDGETIMLESIL